MIFKKIHSPIIYQNISNRLAFVFLFKNYENNKILCCNNIIIDYCFYNWT